VLGVAGTVTGVPLARSFFRLIESQLCGMTPNDPLASAGGSLLLLAVVVLAAWIPPLRAVNVDPLIGLRAL